MEGQRKPERPAECKALPARNCPYYIVRRSRCGFLTLLLSLYSRLSMASCFSRERRTTGRNTGLETCVVHRLGSLCSKERRSLTAELEGHAPSCPKIRAPTAPRPQLLSTAVRRPPLLESEGRASAGPGTLAAKQLFRQRFLCRQQGPDKVLRTVAPQLTRRIRAPSPGESGRSKLCDREKGLGRA